MILTMLLDALASLGSMLESQWVMFLRVGQILGISSGYLQGRFRVCSGYVLFRVCKGYVQGMFTGHILGVPWAYVKHILGISPAYLGHILGLSEAYHLHISGMSWAYFRHMSCISQAYLGHISGIS